MIANGFSRLYFREFCKSESGGAEIDLLLARGLRAIMEDTGAASATVINQGAGTDPLAPGVSRRGFADSVAWLPA